MIETLGGSVPANGAIFCKSPIFLRPEMTSMVAYRVAENIIRATIKEKLMEAPFGKRGSGILL
jgi:hypothetical protein